MHRVANVAILNYSSSTWSVNKAKINTHPPILSCKCLIQGYSHLLAFTVMVRDVDSRNDHYTLWWFTEIQWNKAGGTTNLSNKEANDQSTGQFVAVVIPEESSVILRQWRWLWKKLNLGKDVVNLNYLQEHFLHHQLCSDVFGDAAPQQ